MWCKKIENSKGVRYRFSERMKNPDTNKYVSANITFDDNNRFIKKQAQEKLFIMLQEKIKPVAEKEAEKINSLTFEQVIQAWFERKAKIVKSETMNSIECYVKRIKKGIPKDLLFIDFSPALAEKIVEDMYYDEKLSHSYSNTTLNTIKDIFRHAKKAKYIDDISDYLELKLDKRPATPEELKKAKNKYLERDELKICLSELMNINKRVALAMEFMSLTGLRCGEMLALRKIDYDRQKAIIDINGTITKSACNGEDIQRGTPKNQYSYRKVELSKRAIDILEWFILENKKSAQWHSRKYKDKGYIFTTQTGNPYNIQYLNKILRKLNINGKHISTHVFRHTHISLLSELGVELKAIMERVGHHDPTTTLAIYTHVTNKMKDDTINKLNSLVI